MGVILDQSDIDELWSEFAVECLYFQARISPERRRGTLPLTSLSVYGYFYSAPVRTKLIRTSIDYRIINTAEGGIYRGGAKFTIPKNLTDDDGTVVVNQSIHERIFDGDIIVVKDKPMRDYDVLKRGVRDIIFAYDVTKIISVSYVPANGIPIFYTFGTDYTIHMNGNPITGVVQDDQSIEITGATIAVFGDHMLFGDFNFNENVDATEQVINRIEVVWLDGGQKPPTDESYAVEFLCSPNYIVYEAMAKPRGTLDDDLPKMVMAVKRAFFNPDKTKIDTVDTRQSTYGRTEQHIDTSL